MPNSKDSFDLLIVGGGLAGASLGRSMALAGFRVLIIEKELKFRDRIRGEILLPWGSVEAKDLGIYDILLETCAQEAAREHFFYSGRARSPFIIRRCRKFYWSRRFEAVPRYGAALWWGH